MFASTAHATAKSDTYSCPKLAKENGQLERASGIDLFSGPPSELAQLKPDNDEDDTGPGFWTLDRSESDYWYECIYESRGATLEFKLPRAYARCTNMGTGKVWDKLRCN
ncbi:MAG: STY0301 family protein [Georgfuchsia sp.]